MSCDWCGDSKQNEHDTVRWLILTEEGVDFTRELDFCTYACLKRWCAA